jgi:hypothetical protein
MDETDKKIDTLSEQFNMLISRMEKDRNNKSGTNNQRPNSLHQYELPNQYKNIQHIETTNDVYYEAYVSLVADYLILRFGEKGAEEILLEGMYKGWASPKVVRDIMDHTNNQSRGNDSRPHPYGIGMMSPDVEDKILLTSLLRNLDRPVTNWEEPTHLFMLLALVTRTRESKLIRT